MLKPKPATAKATVAKRILSLSGASREARIAM